MRTTRHSLTKGIFEMLSGSEIDPNRPDVRRLINKFADELTRMKMGSVQAVNITIPDLGNRKNKAFIDAAAKQCKEGYNYLVKRINDPSPHEYKIEYLWTTNSQQHADMEQNKQTCDHNWQPYYGLSETFHFCTKCDEKRK